jgi:hypothetical protein
MPLVSQINVVKSLRGDFSQGCQHIVKGKEGRRYCGKGGRKDAVETIFLNGRMYCGRHAKTAEIDLKEIKMSMENLFHPFIYPEVDREYSEAKEGYVNEKHIEEHLLGGRACLIWAQTGTGKTTATAKFITHILPRMAGKSLDHLCVLFLTHRKSLGRDITRRFRDSDNFGALPKLIDRLNNRRTKTPLLPIISYQDDKDAKGEKVSSATFWKYSFFVAEYEQLTHFPLDRIKNHRYDLIVTDECDDGINQFFSQTMDKRRSACMTVFLKLVQRARYIIALDALLSKKSEIFYKDILGRENVSVIHYLRKNKKGKAVLCVDYGQFHKRMAEGHQDGKKQWGVWASLSAMEVCHAILQRKGVISKKEDNYRSIHSRMDDKEKDHILDHLNEIVADPRIKRFDHTQVITNGVDVNLPLEKTFHFVTAYLTPLTSGSRTGVQSVARCRQLRDNLLYFYVSKKGRYHSLPIEVSNVREWIQNRKHCLMRGYDIEDWAEMSEPFQNAYVYYILERNLDKLFLLQKFIQFLREDGWEVLVDFGESLEFGNIEEGESDVNHGYFDIRQIDEKELDDHQNIITKRRSTQEIRNEVDRYYFDKHCKTERPKNISDSMWKEEVDRLFQEFRHSKNHVRNVRDEYYGYMADLHHRDRKNIFPELGKNLKNMWMIIRAITNILNMRTSCSAVSISLKQIDQLYEHLYKPYVAEIYTNFGRRIQVKDIDKEIDSRGRNLKKRKVQDLLDLIFGFWNGSKVKSKRRGGLYLEENFLGQMVKDYSSDYGGEPLRFAKARKEEYCYKDLGPLKDGDVF